MTKKKTTNKPRMRIKTEVLIILVFFLSFIAWAVSQCNAKKQEYVLPTEAEALATDPDTLALNGSSMSPISEADSQTLRPQSESSNQLSINGRPSAENNNTPIIQTVYATKLYVSINNLKLRRAPSVDSPFIIALTLFDELTFLNEVSDSTDIISLGNGIITNEPWVKVRHWKGNEGWVYGAGVHYYKVKFPGLE